MDSVNTTAYDGAECVHCGDDATGYDDHLPTCDRCHDAELATTEQEATHEAL